jgi:hypothetical protein
MGGPIWTLACTMADYDEVMEELNVLEVDIQLVLTTVEVLVFLTDQSAGQCGVIWNRRKAIFFPQVGFDDHGLSPFGVHDVRQFKP